MKVEGIVLSTVLFLTAVFHPQPSAALGTGFIENRGQVDEQVKYYVPGGRAIVYFTPTAVVLDLREGVLGRASGSEGGRACAVYIHFENANPSPRIEARGEISARYSYFVGNDPAKWRTDVRAYSQVVYHDLWPGVDLVYRNDAGGLVYEAILAPQADQAALRFRTEGGDRVTPLADGSFRVETPAGSLTHLPPSAACPTGGFSWEAESDEPGEGTSSEVADNPAALLWSTFLGGSGYDRGTSLALDATGNPVVTGETYSSGFPTTAGAYDPSHNGETDVFVAKLSAAGSSLLWGTFLGGSSHDWGYSLALDATGNPVVTGSTYSSNFPTTSGAYDRSHNGSTDVFVAKLSAAGSSLLWSTFLGGSDYEYGLSLALSPAGYPVVTGYTSSSTFPTTPAAYDPSHNGNYDVFVARLHASGSSLLWSTFLGGNGDDVGSSLALDPSGNPLVTGYAQSSNFPTTPGVYDPSHNGNYDVFVAKLSAAGSSLLWSTFLGDRDDDEGMSLALDSSGNPVVTGSTNSSGFPTTPGAFDRSLNGSHDAFAAQLDASGSSLSWSTFLGGSDDDQGLSLTVDPSGHPVLTGPTYSSDFPTTPGAYDPSFNGGASTSDVFAAELDASGSSLLWSTFLGGSADDGSTSLVLDPSGNSLVTGSTQSSDFPPTPGAYDPSPNGSFDVFVVKLDRTAMTSDVASAPAAAPASLVRSSPNPAAHGSVLRFTADQPGSLTIGIFDSAGRLIRVLPGTFVEAGTHESVWDGRDEKGAFVKPGVYLYRVSVGEQTRTGKIVVAR